MQKLLCISGVCVLEIITQTLRVMKITALLLIAFVAQVNAKSWSQQITFSGKKAALETVFQVIERQTGYVFFYEYREIAGAKPVTLSVKNEPLYSFLEKCFENQPFGFVIEDKTIMVTRKHAKSTVDLGSAANLLIPPITVRGRIRNDKGEPAVGVTVSIKGTNKATSTNSDGTYVLENVDGKSTLVITGTDIETYEVKLNDKVLIDVTVMQKVSKLDEAVVVAYNTTTQRANTGSVVVVSGEQVQNLPNRSVDKSLQGLVPGLLVTKGTGQPGGGLGNFVLRGIATGGSASNGATSRNPLIVIDGIPVSQDPAQATTNSITYNNPMAQLNPSDIETITVLKDASAIALYGSKASNGVILIVTKKGKAGKTVFGFRHQTDVSEAIKGKTRLLDQREYLDLLYETYRNTDPVYWTDARIKADLFSKFPYVVKSPGDTSFYPASNWMERMYNDRATTFSNEVSISGGNEKSNFYLNLEYTDQNGIQKKTDYNRRSIRFNYENRPATWLKIGINTSLSYNVQNYGYSTTLQSISGISPLNPITNNNGTYIDNYTWGLGRSSSLISNNSLISNPVVANDLNIYRNISYRVLSKLYGEIALLKSFTLVSSIGSDFMLTEAKEKIHPRLTESELSVGIGRIGERDIRAANIIATNLLRFDKSFKNRYFINALAGHESQILTRKTLYLTKEGLTSNPGTDQLNVGTFKEGSGLTNKQTLLSYFGQVNFNFDKKYFLSASIRTDGSSLFGENNRFGSHWSIGTGWVVSSEPFLNLTKGWLDYLKIRGSIGSAGNSAGILSRLRYDNLIVSTFLNDPAVYIAAGNPPGNPSIQWEKTFTWDAGLELNMFNKKVVLTADIYQRKTNNLLGETNLPLVTGFIGNTSNIGDMKNTGIEISISSDIIRSKSFTWNLNTSWSKNKNVLVRSFFPFEFVSGNLLANANGNNYNSFYMPRWAGVNPDNGKPQWIDSSGKATSNYGSARKEFVGKPQPDGFGAITNTISYRRVELSMMLYYQYGFDVFNNGSTRPLENDGTDPYLNQSKEALDRWQKPGDVAKNPRRLLFGRFNSLSDGGTGVSTRYLYKGDFINLSNVVLSYNFSSAVTSRLRIALLKVYVQGNSLFTWSRYPGPSPDGVNTFGQAGYDYPISRSFSAGINVNF